MLGTNDPRPMLRAVGLIGWAVLLGLYLAWEGLGLAFAREGWPSMSDLLRNVSRPVVGRWLLLALWIWIGWHLFVRGWQPLLRGSPAAGPPAAAMTLSEILRQVVTPLVATYALLLGMVALYARRPQARAWPRTTGGPSPAGSPGALRLTGRIASSLVIGYVAFLAVVLTYYAAVANQTPQFLRAAASGGAFITFAVALPGLLLMSGLAALRRRRSAG